MRILVTGATGFIGRTFVRQASEAGHDVIALVRERDGALPVVASSIRVIGGCLEAPPWGELLRCRPEVIVHSAWFAEPRTYLSSPENLKHLEFSRVFLKRWRDTSVNRILVLGTCAEYPETKEPLVESAATHYPPFRTGSEAQPPLGVQGGEPTPDTTLYARCKSLLRQEIKAMLTGTEIQLSWARIFHPYGPGEHPERLCSSVIRSLLAGETVSLRNPYAIRDMIHIEDVGSALLRIVERGREGAINVGTGRAVTIEQAARMLAHLVGRPDLVTLANPSLDRSLAVGRAANVDRLEALGWEPTIELELGLEQMLNHLKDESCHR